MTPGPYSRDRERSSTTCWTMHRWYYPCHGVRAANTSLSFHINSQRYMLAPGRLLMASSWWPDADKETRMMASHFAVSIRGCLLHILPYSRHDKYDTFTFCGIHVTARSTVSHLAISTARQWRQLHILLYPHHDEDVSFIFCWIHVMTRSTVSHFAVSTSRWGRQLHILLNPCHDEVDGFTFCCIHVIMFCTPTPPSLAPQSRTSTWCWHCLRISSSRIRDCSSSRFIDSAMSLKPNPKYKFIHSNKKTRHTDHKHTQGGH